MSVFSAEYQAVTGTYGTLATVDVSDASSMRVVVYWGQAAGSELGQGTVLSVTASLTHEFSSGVSATVATVTALAEIEIPSSSVATSDYYESGLVDVSACRSVVISTDGVNENTPFITAGQTYTVAVITQ